MSQTITAVYEDGILRPLSPLQLPNKTRVTVQIETPESDPVLELIGVFSSEKPLIDNIPISEDPDLYLVAEAMGTAADGLHAWDIAPTRYRRGDDGQPVRLD